jgi:glutamate N-acetyltransferase/amino-acid N-acetyltransferase
LGCGAIEVAVCSTGIIGEQLPRATVLAGVEKAAAELAATAAAGTTAATAVLTTDHHPKQTHVAGPGFSVGGFAKGSGMIAPAMATMLVVLTTDAVADAATCDAALRSAVGTTFDRLDIDGGTSTNDTVLLLASGASGFTPSAAELTAAVHAACTDLCLQLQADAEGVTKHVTVAVTGARSEADAVSVARTVAQDNLCKTAFFAGDPNWGRIAMAVGRAPGEVDARRLGIAINGVPLCRDGVAVGDRHAADMSGRELTIAIELGLGDGAAEILTTDLSHAYVEENSAYSS